jgi:hypothetical protein
MDHVRDCVNSRVVLIEENECAELILLAEDIVKW